MIFERDDKRRPVAYRADIPKGGIRIPPGQSAVLQLQPIVYDRGPISRDWQAITLVLAILTALVFALTLPKDHSVLRLGPGCYYSVTDVGPFNIQREVCR